MSHMGIEPSTPTMSCAVTPYIGTRNGIPIPHMLLFPYTYNRTLHIENNSVCSPTPPNSLLLVIPSLATVLDASLTRLSGPHTHTPTPPFVPKFPNTFLKLGRSKITSELGIGGTASGLHRHVTYIETCTSSVGAAALRISISIGANQSIEPENMINDNSQEDKMKGAYGKIVYTKQTRSSSSAPHEANQA